MCLLTASHLGQTSCPTPLLIQGVLPGPVVGIIVGRDALLVTGAFAARAKSLGWRWPGAAEFFRVGSAAAPSGLAAPMPAGGPGGGSDGAGSDGGAGGSSLAPAAPLVQPLYISKVNTVFQLGLVGTCILHSWLGWPGEGPVWAASALTAGTTVWSCAAYFQAYRQGRVLAPAAASSRGSSAGGDSRGGSTRASSSSGAGKGSSMSARHENTV